jgi:protein CMS1
LFAKHFKVSEQIEHLQKTKICLAAGTPNRIGKILADSEALHIRQQTVILLDLTFRDSSTYLFLSGCRGCGADAVVQRIARF